MHPRRLRSRARLLLVALLATAACSDGSAGPPGPMGPDGAAGDPAEAAPVLSGTVDVPGNSPAPEGVPVVAVRLAPDGQELAPIAAGLTDASGGYALSLPLNETASSNLAVVAYASGHRLKAVTTDLVQNVDAVTNGVAEVLALMVRAQGGLVMSDFDAAEIEALIAAASADLTAVGTDLEDPDAVLDLLLDSIGAAVSAAADVTATAVENMLSVTQDPAGADSAVSLTYNLTDGAGYTWDVRADGGIGDGEDDAYDVFFILSVDGQDFAADTAVLRDARTVVLTETDIAATGLNATRKVYVSPDMGFARYTEMFSNPTAAPITIEVGVRGDLGSNEAHDQVHFSGSSDRDLEAGDEWLVATHGFESNPSAWIFSGGTPVKVEDEIDVTWAAVEVPAGQTVTLFHFAFQGAPGGDDTLVEQMIDLGGAPTPEYYTDATIADAAAGLNGGWSTSVVGEAGSAAPREMLTITNTATGDVRTKFAGLDGAFRSDIPTSAGDMITVAGNRGTQFTLTVQ